MSSSERGPVSLLRDGSAVLSDFFALSCPDGVGADPGSGALSGASKAGSQDGRQAGPCSHGAGADRPRADRSARHCADVRAGRFSSSLRRQRARPHAADSCTLAGHCRLADRRQEALWLLVAGAYGSAGSHSESAAEARRLRQKRVGVCCQHWLARCCCFWRPSSLPESSWRLASRAPAVRGRFSIASSAPAAAKNLPSCPRRRFARWHWVCSAWPLSRPSSSACSC